MNEQECLSKMVPPGQRRPEKLWGGGGVMQIMVTRACDKACYNCTQGSNLGGKPAMMTPEEFDLACQSLKGYPFLVGVFGGNPCLHPDFDELCRILRGHFPKEKCGLWSNNLHGYGVACRRTFRPDQSNLNVHLDQRARDEMWRDWPEARPYIKGHDTDSRHSPPFVAMLDVMPNESQRWELISGCDINKHWSALVGVVPGKGLRGFFCEIAYAQAALHCDDPDWPDTGLVVDRLYDWQQFDPRPMAEQVMTDPGEAIIDMDPAYVQWWQLPMRSFVLQVRQHCHRCGVPLRGKGELACSQSEDSREQVSATHGGIYRPKVKGRKVEVVTDLVQLGTERLKIMTNYLQNAKL